MKDDRYVRIKNKWKAVYVLPVLSVAALLPLCARLVLYEVEFTEYPWFPNQETWSDVFLLVKSRVFVFLAAVMALMLLASALRRRVKPDRAFLPLVFLSILQLLSALFSAYPSGSFGGIMEQYESVWMLLSYTVLCMYCFYCVSAAGQMKWIAYALFAGLFLSCILGLTQLVQADFWETVPGKWIMVPESLSSLRDSLRFNFSTEEWGSVYMALYNPNYAGIYVVMLLPLIFLWGEKKLYPLGAAAAICLIGTFSVTAILAGLLTAAVGFVVFSGRFQRPGRKRGVAILFAAVLILTAGIAGIVVSSGSDDEYLLESVTPETDAVRIVYNGKTICLSEIKLEDGAVKQNIYYEDGTQLPIDWDDDRGECVPLDSGLEDIRFQAYASEGISYVAFRYQDITFRFSRDLGTGKYEYITINGKVDELCDAATAFDLRTGTESLLSGRVYIWNRVLPLIAGNALLGTGPETFMLVFPQDDYVQRANLGYGFFTEILTNAHSFYLQTALQTGV
ncbi:MAG: O-antigen ligase family protein, partial [Lachnospiraceae bacterium]|nr:O-antigen ligase family protein [Lachnospiraceae bacterium]